jgi:hypothetical protein
MTAKMKSLWHKCWDGEALSLLLHLLLLLLAEHQ